MNTPRIYKGLLTAAIMICATVSYQQAQAAIGCNSTSVCCPKCKHSCVLKAEKVDVEKSCFEVESKTICIPRVVFPWQMPKKKSGCGSCDGHGCSTCVNNGASARTVKILKTKKYKCPECKYSWSAEKSSCCGGSCSSGCSGCSSCSSCDTGYMGTSYSSQNYSEAPYAEPVQPSMDATMMPPSPMVDAMGAPAHQSPVYVAPNQPSASYQLPEPYVAPPAASQGSGTR